LKHVRIGMEEAKKGKRNEEIMKKSLKASFSPCAYTPTKRGAQVFDAGAYAPKALVAYK
ncbi:hypothetical protein PIB30_055439, partial [Stylosanthes scabra]|nr:hypothetical protein [Stylosanthes scabra]